MIDSGGGCYTAPTAQPGTTITVMEMGPVRVTASAFLMTDDAASWSYSQETPLQ